MTWETAEKFRKKAGILMEFRPCIDLHGGKVKQLVGGSLTDRQAKENFVSEQDAAFYAWFYRESGIRGGHIILLNKEGTEDYEETKRQALQALHEYPGGLQVGGGNGHYVAEQECVQFGYIAGGKEYEHGADGHAECPHDGYGGVFAQIEASRHPLHSHRRAYGEQGGSDYGIDSEKIPESESSEAGMGDTAGYGGQAACHDICAYKAGTDAQEQRCRHRIAEERIVEVGQHIV